ncbi:hypothetical protein [Ensifer adhaerens]|uniref:hypothetical protein n=1 Tax=Ensifer adhaerens TaxID=106592 RepID=UPI0015C400B5|nr:hypothetical protein [Ensifer adhaerens]
MMLSFVCVPLQRTIENGIALEHAAANAVAWAGETAVDSIESRAFGAARAGCRSQIFQAAFPASLLRFGGRGPAMSFSPARRRRCPPEAKELFHEVEMVRNRIC